MNMDVVHSGGHDFDMSSAIEDHMSKEDLGPEAPKQDWTDLQTLRKELRWWEDSISCLYHPTQERNRWSQVPPRTQDKKNSRPRLRGRNGKGKEISCFHASTRVRMFTTIKGSPEYKRMDKLIKGDKLWTRRYKRNRLEPSQGHVSIMECVMTFACPPEGQPMVEVEGNLLTPDHYVARGNGEWSTAGELTHPETESTTQLARMVYNIKLQSGSQIELGNRIYAATLGARFDSVDPGKEPIHSEEASRYLQDLSGYASGHIHWALGTASVDCRRMPSPKRLTDLPSKMGTSTLLEKDILEVILVTQHADQKWIDTLCMIRRVHSTWHHVARSIYLEFTIDTLRVPIQEEKETWRSTFYREKEKVQKRIRNRREQTDPVFTQTARNVLGILRTYPATLDILVVAMTILQWRIPHLTTEDKYERELFVGGAHADTLYSTLSRHTLRPTPYAAQDLNSQIQEHIAVTRRSTRVLGLGTLIIDTLEKFIHCCPSAIPTLLNSLRVLTAGRTPSKKQDQDWKFTNQTAHILSMNLRKMDSEDLIKLSDNGLDPLKIFVQSHLISQGSRWMKRKAYAAWSAV